MALDSKKQNQLTKEIKYLRGQLDILPKLTEDLALAIATSKELLAENTALRKRNQDLVKEVALLHDKYFKKNDPPKCVTMAQLEFATKKEEQLHRLNKILAQNKVLLQSGKEKVNASIAKTFPTIKIMTGGQRSFKPETIKDLNLLIICTDYLGHTETEKAEALAKKYNIPIIFLPTSGISTLTKKLCEHFKIK